MQNYNTSIHWIWNQIPDLYENITKWSQQQLFFMMRTVWTCNEKKNMFLSNWYAQKLLICTIWLHSCSRIFLIVLKKKWYNNKIKTWIWQGILHSVDRVYVLHSTRPFVSKIAFGFAFIVKNVYRYVKHFRDWSFLWKTEMFDNAMTWHHQ